MTEHQIIARRIATVGGCLILSLILIGIGAAVADGNRSFYFYISAAILMLILGVVSARWFLSALAAVTGMTFLLSFRGIGFFYLLGSIFAPVILPIGLVVLIVRYGLARRRYSRETQPVA